MLVGPQFPALMRLLEPRKSWSLQRSVAIPIVIVLIFQCDMLSHDLFIVLVLFVGWIGALLVSLWLFVDALITRLKQRPAPHMWTALLLAISVGPGLPYLNAPFLWVSASHKLLRHQSKYLDVVAVADAGGNPPEIYLSEPGPPAFYYFVWNGFADNSWGIVHDRSRTFGAANPRTTFGGKFLQNIHLWGPWYFLELT